MTIEELQVLITANTTELKKELNATKTELQKMEKNASKTTNSISNLFKKMIPLSAIALGVKQMANFMKTSEQAYKEQIQNETRLLAVMKQLDNASKQDVKDILNIASAQQELGVVGDEVQLAGAQELSTYVRKADSIKKLIPQLNNMIAQQYGYNATQEEAINIATMMGKVLEGQTGALSRYGYYFDENEEKILKFGTEEEKVATLTSIIHDSIGDVNEALGDTAVGKQIQLANAWGDVKEQLGYVVVQVKQVLVPVFQVLVTWLGTAVSYLRQFLQLLGFTAKKQNNVNQAISGGASAEENYGDAVEKSTKAQNKQLASFDEMNVLKEDSGDSNGSSGGGSSSGAGGFNNIDFNVGIDGDVEISEKIKELKDKLSKMWDSEPIKAYRKLIGSEFKFIKDLTIQLGTDLGENMSTTWTNIEDNVNIATGNMTDLFTNMWTDMSEGIDTWGQPIIDGVSDLFNSMWKDAIDPALQLISKEWADFSKILVDLWDEYGKPLVDNVGEMVDKIIKLFKKIWDDVLQPIIQPFLETLSDLWDKHIKGLIKEVGEFIGELVNGAMEIYNKFIQPILMWLIDKLSPVFTYIGNLVSGVFGTIASVVSDVISGVIKVLKGIIEFIVGVFTGNWKKAWQGIKDIFSGLISGIASIFKAPINLIIDGINAFTSGLNKIKIPDWVPGVGGKGFNVPKIPKLAQGGVVDKPTYAMIGEAGKEVVMPLERNTGWMDNLAEKINSRSGNRDNPIQIVINIGEDTIMDKVIDGINQKNFETNGEVFNI